MFPACFVSKIIWWGTDGPRVTFKVTDWDRDANRPREHHGRPIRWDQQKDAEMMARFVSGDEKAKKAFAFFRKDIVGAYTACGWPEEKWPRGDDGNPAPPWHLFFVHSCADGTRVPILLSVTVAVQPMREKFPTVKAVSVVPGPIQAPLPYDLPPEAAAFYGWKISDRRTIECRERVTKNGYRYDAMSVDVVVVDKFAVPMPHLGMRTYRDL